MTLKEFMESNHKDGGFVEDQGIILTTVKEGFAQGEIAIENRHLNPHKVVHGGCIFALMDTVGAVAAMTRGNYVVSTYGNITFINPAMKTNKLIAKTTEIKAGKTLLIYDIDVFTETDVHISKGSITYYRMNKEIEFEKAEFSDV